MPDEELIRLNVDVPKSLMDSVGRRIPRGSKAEIVRALLRMLCRDLKERGLRTIDPLLKDTATISDIDADRPVQQSDTTKRRKPSGHA